MIIEETIQLKQKLIETLTEQYFKERTDIHVTDLVSCLRKAGYAKIQPMPLSETDLMLFVLGEGHHQVIQLLAGKGAVIAEQNVELEGVVGTVDLLDSGVPIEIKTRRTKDREPEDSHLKQLSYYMAMVPSNVGLLLYLMLNNLEDDEPKFICRTITLTDKELGVLREELLHKKDVLTRALKASDPLLIPRDESFRNCVSCQYTKTCKPEIQHQIIP